MLLAFHVIVAPSAVSESAVTATPVGLLQEGADLTLISSIYTRPFDTPPVKRIAMRALEGAPTKEISSI